MRPTPERLAEIRAWLDDGSSKRIEDAVEDMRAMFEEIDAVMAERDEGLRVIALASESFDLLRRIAELMRKLDGDAPPTAIAPMADGTPAAYRMAGAYCELRKG